MLDADCSCPVPSIHWGLRCGLPVRWRPLGADDRPALEAMLLRQSRASRYQRFHGAVNGFTPAQLARLTCDDDPLQLGLALTSDAPGARETILAEARFASEDGRSAELAVIVDEHWQRQGIGWCALHVLADAARERGLLTLNGRVLDNNDPMLALVRRAGLPLARDADDPRVRCFRLDLDRPLVAAGFSAPASARATAAPETSRASPCAR